MKKLPADKGLKIFDINWRAKTAGPSPLNNERIEIFLLGCKKAAEGRPCPGCFNSITWDANKATHSWDPTEVANKIAKTTPVRYITIGGGEPTDQIDHLVPFVKKLKELDFHILMYTWRDLEKESNSYSMTELLKYVDIVIDGEYIQEERLYQENIDDGFFSSIGSGNQRIWDIQNKKYEYMRDLKGLKLDDNNKLIYIYK